MSSPQDLASGTNSQATYKERHGDRQIHQFNVRTFPYSCVSILQLYPTVSQVTDVSG